MNAPTLPTETKEPVPNPNTGIGGNNPPPFDADEVAKLTGTADEFLKACDIWLKTDVTSEELAAQLADQIAGLRANDKAVEEARKAAKEPHDKAAKAVQDAFNPIRQRYGRALKVMKEKMGAWLDKKRIEEENRKRIEREEAEAKAAEARRMAMDAENTGSIDDQLAAEEAQKEAEKAANVAAKPVNVQAKSASGAGRTVSQRTRNEVTITNIRFLFMHMQEHPDVHAVLLRLATAEANAKGFSGDIPGTNITKKTVAV
ncbi:MAG: hypothetical protein ACPGSI_16595 [Pikeienuella sp.]